MAHSLNKQYGITKCLKQTNNGMQQYNQHSSTQYPQQARFKYRTHPGMLQCIPTPQNSGTNPIPSRCSFQPSPSHPLGLPQYNADFSKPGRACLLRQFKNIYQNLKPLPKVTSIKLEKTYAPPK
jgi:hypothetical protein